MKINEESLVAVDATSQIGDRLMSEEEFAARDAARGVDAAGEPLVVSETQFRVITAFNTSALKYLVQCLVDRTQETAKGSFFTVSQTIETLKAAKWEPYEHPDVNAPAVAFKAPIQGTVGVVDLRTLPVDQVVTLYGKSEDENPDITGTVVFPKDQLPKADFTTLLLGPSDDGEVVWTFFPGEPVKFSSIKGKELLGKKVTVAEALALGILYGKVTS
jgi:hypothetical protein